MLLPLIRVCGNDSATGALMKTESRFVFTLENDLRIKVGLHYISQVMLSIIEDEGNREGKKKVMSQVFVYVCVL